MRSSVHEAAGAPESLSVLLEGESLFNDAAAIVLLGLLISLALSLEHSTTPGGVVLDLLTVFLGGLRVGLSTGLICLLRGCLACRV